MKILMEYHMTRERGSIPKLYLQNTNTQPNFKIFRSLPYFIQCDIGILKEICFLVPIKKSWVHSTSSVLISLPKWIHLTLML